MDQTNTPHACSLITLLGSLFAKFDASSELIPCEKSQGIINGLLAIRELNLSALTINANELAVTTKDGRENRTSVIKELRLFIIAVHKLDVILGTIRSSITDVLHTQAITGLAAFYLDDVRNAQLVQVPLLGFLFLALRNANRITFRAGSFDALFVALVGLLDDGVEPALRAIEEMGSRLGSARMMVQSTAQMSGKNLHPSCQRWLG